MKKKYIYEIIAISSGILFMILFNKFISFRDTNNKEGIKKMYIYGEVDSIFFIRHDHNVKVIRVRNNNKYEIHNAYNWYQNDSISLGDSVFKKSGELNLKVIKKDRIIECQYVDLTN